MTTTRAVVVRARRGLRITQFGPLRISFDDRVLEPRAWTTMQARWANQLAEVAPGGPVLELCSGAGQIGLMAIHGTGRRLVAVDSSSAACSFIRINARAAGLEDQVEVRRAMVADACTPGERFGVIVADPPWVPHDQIGRFPEDPVSAIDGGHDGLSVANDCLQVIADRLLPEGAALLQVGPDQVSALERALPAGLTMTETRIERGRGAVVKIIRLPPEARLRPL